MKFMRFLKWFNRKDMKIAALEAKYGALDIIHSSLVDLYKELREENEELKQVITLSPNITFPVNFIRELASGFC